MTDIVWTHPVDKIINDIEKADFLTLVHSGGDHTQELMDAATDLFEPFPAIDQAHCMALMFGILLGTLEGQAVDLEKRGVFITLEDRLRIFCATVRVVAKEAQEAAGHPDCPKPRLN